MVAIDTTFLVDLYWEDSPRHKAVLKLLQEWIISNTRISIYYYCFNEFIHVISDSKRFETPYSVEEALEIVDIWRGMSNIHILFPNENSFARTVTWMSVYKLGRNRINDSSMAACYVNEGVTEVVTANPKDFELFNCFNLVDYRNMKVE